MKHPLNNLENQTCSQHDSSLQGKTVAIINAEADQISRLQGICSKYKAKLILTNHETTVPYAIKIADHVMCYQNCPNQRLCEAAYENCALLGKEVHILENTSINTFNRQLEKITVETRF